MSTSEHNYHAASQRLHEQLGRLIAETTPGERLLSEPKLAKKMGVSRATLREAMRTFETQGLIHRRQGVGTFVIHPSQMIQTGLEVLESMQTLAQRIGLPVQMSAYEIDQRAARGNEAQTLNIPEGQPVMQVSWIVEAENRPVAYLEDVLPQGILSEQDIEDDFDGSILDMLLQRGELALTNSRTEITAAAADSTVARALGIQRGDVVLVFEATLFSAGGRAVDLSHSYFLPGYFRFHVNRQVGRDSTAHK
jgi:GntR family transcriptional regulator